MLKSIGGEIVVELDGKGEITVDGRPVSPSGLEKTLREGCGGDTNCSVLVRADQEAHHGDVITILDKAMTSDFNRLSVALLPVKGEGRLFGRPARLPPGGS